LLHVIIQSLLFAALAQSWGVLGGLTGLVDLGFCVYLSLGAYTSAILYIHYFITPWISMWLGGLVAMIYASFFCFCSLKLKGPFFTLTSIAFLQLIRILFIISPENITGSSVGVTIPFRGGDPFYFQFSEKISYYYIILFLFILVAICVNWVMKSKLGFSLQAIRDDQVAAEALGVDSRKCRLKAMLISSFFAGVLGSFYVNYFLFIDPFHGFDVGLSASIAIIAILGGLGSFWGPLIGAFLLTPIQLYTNVLLGGTYVGVHLILYAIAAIITIYFFPFGIFGLLKQRFAKYLKKF
jgi:branched-chain amino acid transport system permease protein